MSVNARRWKLFRMIGSDVEAEALAAIRMLKKELASENMNWNQFVDNIEKRLTTPPTDLINLILGNHGR